MGLSTLSITISAKLNCINRAFTTIKNMIEKKCTRSSEINFNLNEYLHETLRYSVLRLIETLSTT